MGLTPTVEAEVANYFWRNQATVPRIGSASDSRLGLCDGAPGESGTSTANEITTASASRIQLVASTWGTPSANVISYGAQITWSPTATEAATHWVLSSNGTFSTTHDFWEAFPATVNFASGDPLRFRSGALQLAVSGLFGHSEGSALLRNLIAGTSLANTTIVYFALSTTAPNPDGTNVTEPSGGSYARVSATLSSVFSSAPSGASPTSCTSGAAIVWPEATGGWGTVTHWVAYTASTGGTLVYYGELTSSEIITTGLQPQFAAGDLVFTVD